MKNLFILAVWFIAGSEAFAQSAKAVYFEVGGPGLLSANFDTRFSGRENGLGARIGFGAFYIQDNGATFIPIGLTYLIGRDGGLHYVELGGGVTPVFGHQTITDKAFATTFGHLNLGYRLQEKEGGFFFRVALNPVFGLGFFWPFYGGLSVGYKFRSGTSN